MDMTDTLAVPEVKRIMKYLPVAYRDGKNREARHQMALAALEAGICINNSSVTLVHGLSRPIGALFHVAHGISNAMLLNVCFSFALEGANVKIVEICVETTQSLNAGHEVTAVKRTFAIRLRYLLILRSNSGWFLYVKKILLNKRDSAMIGKEKIKDITISEKERQLQ